MEEGVTLSMLFLATVVIVALLSVFIYSTVSQARRSAPCRLDYLSLASRCPACSFRVVVPAEYHYQRVGLASCVITCGGENVTIVYCDKVPRGAIALVNGSGIFYIGSSSGG